MAPAPEVLFSPELRPKTVGAPVEGFDDEGLLVLEPAPELLPPDSALFGTDEEGPEKLRRWGHTRRAGVGEAALTFLRHTGHVLAVLSHCY